MKAVIMVGGTTKGTRFRPIALAEHFVPKPLFPIAGRPMITHIVEACVKLPEVKEILLTGFYDASLFEEYISATTDEFKVPIRYLKEPQPLGSAGALLHFKAEILENNPEYVIVTNCDIGCCFPLSEVVDFHRKHGKSCTVLGKKVSKDEARLYGCMAKDAATNELLHYAEKPEGFVTDLINCGVYVFSPSMWDTLAEASKHLAADDNELIKSIQDEGINTASLADAGLVGFSRYMNLGKGFMRLEQDVLSAFAGKHVVYITETTGFWTQIKTVGAAIKCSEIYMDDYRKSHPELLYNPGPDSPEIVGTVMIHPTAQVDKKARLGPNVYISAGAKIGPGVRIKESLICENAQIKGHACVLYAVLGWHTVVGGWARIEGSPDKDKKDGEARITILGEGVTVDPEIVVRNCTVLPHKNISKNAHDEIIL